MPCVLSPPSSICTLATEMCQFGGGGLPIHMSPLPTPHNQPLQCGQCGTGLGGRGGCRMSPSRCVPIRSPPKAVCCKDHQHCCPRGYTCNAATQSCEKLLAATPLRFPVPAGPPLSPPRPVATIPADTARACPPGQRCCRSKDGSWARCPFAQVSGWHFGGGGHGGEGGAVSPPMSPIAPLCRAPAVRTGVAAAPLGTAAPGGDASAGPSAGTSGGASPAGRCCDLPRDRGHRLDVPHRIKGF